MRIEWFFILTNLNLLHPKMHCVMFGWNWPSGFREEDFYFFFNVFSLLRNYLLLKRDEALLLNILQSPSPNDALYHLAQCFWRRRFLNFVNVLSLFRNYPALEKAGPFIWRNFSPRHPRMLCALLKLAEWFLRRRFLNFFDVFSLFHNNIISPWKRWGPSFE